MKYLFLLLVTSGTLFCSPKMSPDASWSHQRWVLVEMKGVPVQQSGGRRDAFINFNNVEKRFNGNGGCNQINGTYTLDKKEIRFRDVIATKMSCADIEFENSFLQTLSTVDNYQVEGDDIRLRKKKETVLVLRARNN